MTAMTCALVERLQTIPDPRRQSTNLKHPLVDLILLGFCGVLAGCDDVVEMAEWGKVNAGFFRPFLELPHGSASHDTFTRVFALLQCTTLPEVLLPWLLERWGTGRLGAPGWQTAAPDPAQEYEVESAAWGECVGGATRDQPGAGGGGGQIQ